MANRLMTWIFLISAVNCLEVVNFFKCKSVDFIDFKFGKRRSDGTQPLTFNVTLSQDYGTTNNRVSGKVFVKKGKTEDWRLAITLPPTNGICNYLNVYLGGIWFDMQRQMGMERRKCPLPKGNHHMENFMIDYNKLGFKALPLGMIKHTLEVYPMESNEKLICATFIAKG